MSEENKTLIAARAYLARGLSVFPLNGKIPTTEHGVKDASDDDAQIVEWFPRVRNIGIAIPVGVVVVDVDPRNGGEESFREWLDSYGSEYWTTAMASTGAGGQHYWFRYDGRRLKKNPAVGIDLLTYGRYVVVPPSRTADVYRWQLPLPDDPPNDLPECPGWLLELATPPTTERLHSPHVTSAPTSDDPLNAAAHKMTTWTTLLHNHGWACVMSGPGSGNDEGAKWRHPGSDNQLSATIKHDCLFVYSPNTPFPVTEPGDPHGVTLYRALETLDYHGNRQACIADLRMKGYLPDLLPVADVTELVAKSPHDATQAPQAAADGTPHLTLRDLTDIRMRRVRWLWDGYVPLGGITLLVGQPGVGKSTVTFDLIASITRGVLPGELHGHPHDAVIVATEDSLEHTIKPRLVAAGADMGRVFRVDMLDELGVLSLPVDIPDLEKACDGRHVALIVLDPLMSRLNARLDSHKDLEVRQALEPLNAFTERLGAACIGLMHLNKSGSADPLDAVMASKAFTAVARSVLHAMVDPDEPARHLLGLGKSNLGSMSLPTLTYTFDIKTVGKDDEDGTDVEATKIVWGPEVDTRIADAMLSSAEDRGALADATEWLNDWMRKHSERSGQASQAYADGKKEDHSKRTLGRARQRLGLLVEYIGSPPVVWWTLPDEGRDAK